MDAFLKPMSAAYSRKHWRHRFIEYLRMRPARWVQTRLVRYDVQRRGWRTIRGSPFQSRVGASTRRLNGP